jgi:hypothetical protein
MVAMILSLALPALSLAQSLGWLPSLGQGAADPSALTARLVVASSTRDHQWRDQQRRSRGGDDMGDRHGGADAALRDRRPIARPTTPRVA